MRATTGWTGSQDAGHGPVARLPLAVDLDGTLTLTDTLHESLVRCLKTRPLGLIGTPLHRKAAFKRMVAAHADFDASALPYHAAFLSFLRSERAAGRRIGLFTAADQSIADAVGNHLGLFEMAVGSDGVTNLSGATKAAAIEAAFGAEFVYAGDDAVDAPIFARASGVILVGRVAGLQAGPAKGAHIEALFPVAPASVSVWLRALRLRHWPKNALVFLAPVLAFQSIATLLQAALLFVLLGALASGTYLINDLLDVADDRRHPVKRFRPLAAGAIPMRDGVLAAAVIILASLLTSLVLPWVCLLVLLGYLVATLAYSFLLKRIPMIDVMSLAGLFTLRVVAGSLLVARPISPWLLTFSMLFFLGLAMIKRYAELHRLSRGADERRAGADQEPATLRRARGYTLDDLPILLTAGVASSISAIVLFVIYLIDEQYPRAIYANPGALWCIMPVLLAWTLRLWHLSVHGRVSEDPVTFALKDRMSLAMGAAVLVILLVAHY